MKRVDQDISAIYAKRPEGFISIDGKQESIPFGSGHETYKTLGMHLCRMAGFWDASVEFFASRSSKIRIDVDLFSYKGIMVSLSASLPLEVKNGYYMSQGKCVMKATSELSGKTTFHDVEWLMFR